MLFYRKENKNSTEILTFKIRTRDELSEERCPRRSFSTVRKNDVLVVHFQRWLTRCQPSGKGESI